MDMDRRTTLESAVEFLTAARELTKMASALDARKAKKLRTMADKFTDRGLKIMVADLSKATGTNDHRGASGTAHDALVR